VTAGVVIDDWKLDIFRGALNTAGCEFTEHPGPVPDTLTLRVEFVDRETLAAVIQAANTRARLSRAH
jgi:hypothetical protein